MITLGYVDTPDTQEISQQLVEEDPERGYNAFIVYNSNHYNTIVSVSDTRVVLQCNNDPNKFVAFDGPADEMAQIVARANYKIEKAEKEAAVYGTSPG